MNNILEMLNSSINKTSNESINEILVTDKIKDTDAEYMEEEKVEELLEMLNTDMNHADSKELDDQEDLTNNNCRGDNKELVENITEKLFDVNISEIENDNLEPREKEIINDEDERKKILEEMFDDSKIQAKESPFRIYPDDKQKFTGKTKLVDLRQIVQEYRNGDIDQRVFRILEIIIHHKYITSRQIWQMYLLKYKLYIKRENLKKLLNRMEEKGLVVEFVIESAYGKSSYHCYCADYNGVRLYTALNSESITWKKTDTIQKPYKIKQSLAKNQFLIAFLKNYDVIYELQPRLAWSKAGQEKSGAVVPAVQLTFGQKDSSAKTVFLVEIIRDYPASSNYSDENNWKTDFEEKIVRYGQYLNSVEDMRDLKKYYIIVCAESMAQEKEAIELFYQLRYVRRIPQLMRLKMAYTNDIALLLRTSSKGLLSEIHWVDYNASSGKWENVGIDDNFKERDWHEIDFKKEVIRPLEDFKEIRTITEEKENLALSIYDAVIDSGRTFPIAMVNVAPLLKCKNIDYSTYRYKRLSDMFKDLIECYIVRYQSSTNAIIDITDMMKELLQERSGGKITHQNDQDKNLEKQNQREFDAVREYFTKGFADKQIWRKKLVEEIYCFKNWTMMKAMLAKLTRNNDLSEDGWLHIIAYSYCVALNSDMILHSSEDNYISFDTGVLSFENEKVYLVAKRNYRDNPPWVLEGFATLSSHRFGKMLKEEFKLGIDDLE